MAGGCIEGHFFSRAATPEPGEPSKEWETTP